MRSTGRLDESLDMIKRAQELDPASPVVAENLALGYAYVGNFAAGIASVEKLTQLFPDNPRVHDTAAYVYDYAGRLDDALEAARRAVALADGGALETTVTLARLMAKTGDSDAARLLLEPLLADPESVAFASLQIVGCLVALDQVDAAFDWLERASEQRTSQLATIGILPELEPIRDDSRFQDILRRMNHPLAQQAPN
jgi:tetratricopeptide (TPR) repeat protein